MLSRLVIIFLPRNKRLLISWLQSPSAVILEPPKIKSDTVYTVSPSISHDFILGGSKIMVDGDCSHKIKRCLLLGRKVMTNLDSIFKSRHYFVNKGPSSQGYGFPVVMYGCES